jgi:hypothetical protein
MTRVRRDLPKVLLLLTLMPATVACGSTPGGTPSPIRTTASASPTATPSVSPNAITPAGTISPSATQGGNQATSPTGWTVVSARVEYQWHWPNGDPKAVVTHNPAVPPVPELVAIGAGDHPNDPGERPYNRMSFSFTNAYPSYNLEYVNQIEADGSGSPIALPGYGVLRVAFTPAQAHTQDGTASTILSQPASNLGMTRMHGYAQAGDFEGHLTYGIGITYPIRESNPQIEVRAYEVTYVNAQGVYRYVVAIDVDAR